MAGDGWARRRAAAARHTAATGHAAAEPLAGLAPGCCWPPSSQVVMLSVLPSFPRGRALPTTADPDLACITVVPWLRHSIQNKCPCLVQGASSACCP